jgi:hypothetical protein
VNLSPKHNYKGNSPLSNESVKREGLTRELSNMLDLMSTGKMKTKSIISESLRPAHEQEKTLPNLLDESNLLDEI